MKSSSAGDASLGSIDLEHYRSMGTRLGHWALMAESVASLEILARLATHDLLSFEELAENIHSGSPLDLDPMWSKVLARVAALLPGGTTRLKFSEEILTRTLTQHPKSGTNLSYHRLLAELRYELGDIDGTRRLVTGSGLKDIYHGYIDCDLNNPFTSTSGAIEEWLPLFNRPFENQGLTPVTLNPENSKPFNRLASTADRKVSNGPLISVLMTIYNTEPDDLINAIRSILGQTWTNLELLLIDDCSTNLPDHFMESLKVTDPRIFLLRTESNGGTYRARNLGLQTARGAYVTGQDSDDWSHPERLERQMMTLLANPFAPGVVTRANRTNDALVRISPGYHPECNSEVTLLFRRGDALQIGGYLPIRKAADSEFRFRLERLHRRPSIVLSPDPPVSWRVWAWHGAR